MNLENWAGAINIENSIAIVFHLMITFRKRKMLQCYSAADQRLTSQQKI